MPWELVYSFPVPSVADVDMRFDWRDQRWVSAASPTTATAANIGGGADALSLKATYPGNENDPHYLFINLRWTEA